MNVPQRHRVETLCIEFDELKIEHIRQASLPAFYKGHLLGHYRVDLVVADLVIVEIKSVEPAF